MADPRAPSQQPNHISSNTNPHHSHHNYNPHVPGDNQQDFHWEGVSRPVGMQGEMQYLRHIDEHNYNAAPVHYHLPPAPYPEIPHAHRDVGVAEAAQAQVPHFAPEVQGNYDGHVVYGAQFPAVDPSEAFPAVWPHPAAPANIPPANSLRNLANRYLNNPDTHVNGLRIEPGPGGRFEVWIALELADIF